MPPVTPITGILTAMVTPFFEGKVSFDEIRSFTEFQIKNGVDGLVPAGTTGESPTLDHKEQAEVVRCVVEAAAGRVPVVAGTGSNSTREAVQLTLAATEAGADAMLVVAPYYNKPSPEGLFRHFAEVADATDKPIILYSIPSRCGIEIDLATLERLCKRFSHVNHIKEAGGSCDRVDQIRNALGGGMTILSGDDSLTLPFMALGARGVISVASNLLVRDVKEMVSAALAGDFGSAFKVHRRLYPLFKALFVEPNPVPVKTALERAGLLRSAEVRSPLCEMKESNRKILVEALNSATR